MALRVMSADSHMDLVYLPPDTFTSRMDPKWGDAAPHVVERDGRKWWVSRDAVLGPYGVYGPGVTGGRRGRILAEAGFATGKQTRPSNPIERRADQERDGGEAGDRKSVVEGKRGDLGGRRIIKKKKRESTDSERACFFFFKQKTAYEITR